MSKRHFIIDTDTASFDTVAILMALMWEGVIVDAITVLSLIGLINSQTSKYVGKSMPNAGKRSYIKH